MRFKNYDDVIAYFAEHPNGEGLTQEEKDFAIRAYEEIHGTGHRAKAKPVEPPPEETARKEFIDMMSDLREASAEIVNDLTLDPDGPHYPDFTQTQLLADMYGEAEVRGYFKTPDNAIIQTIRWVDDGHIAEIKERVTHYEIRVTQLKNEIPAAEARLLEIRTRLRATNWRDPAEKATALELYKEYSAQFRVAYYGAREHRKKTEQLIFLRLVLEALEKTGEYEISQRYRIQQLEESVSVVYRSDGTFEATFSEAAAMEKTGSQITRGGGYSPTLTGFKTLRECFEAIERRTGLKLGTSVDV